MLLKVFTVYDSKAGAYLTPFFMRSTGEALRAWQRTVNDPNSSMCTFPSDFTLFEIGEFDDAHGSVKMLESKISLGLALEFKDKRNEEVVNVQAV